MYAIFKNGGKQYRASVGQLVRLEKLNLQIGEMLKFDEVIMIVDCNGLKIGSPVLRACNVIGTVVRHGRLSKIMIVKFRRRKHFRKFQGHRQWFTDVRIKSIDI